MTSPHPINDPVATYLDIDHKVANGGEELYPPTEMARDVARLLLSCRTLIQQNSNLSARVLSASALIDEQAIEIFTKDMEIHELTQKLPEIADES